MTQTHDNSGMTVVKGGNPAVSVGKTGEVEISFNTDINSELSMTMRDTNLQRTSRRLLEAVVANPMAVLARCRIKFRQTFPVELGAPVWNPQLRTLSFYVRYEDSSPLLGFNFSAFQVEGGASLGFEYLNR